MDWREGGSEPMKINLFIGLYNNLDYYIIYIIILNVLAMFLFL